MDPVSQPEADPPLAESAGWQPTSTGWQPTNTGWQKDADGNNK